MSNKEKAPLVPKLRFPDFRDTAGWVTTSLGLACQMQAGKFVSASEIREQSEQGLYPCYGGNGVRGYTATFTHSGKHSLIGRQGALCGNVRQGIGQFHATEHAIVVIPKNGVANDWLFFILDSLNLNRFATGQAQPGLSVDVLEKLPIAIPGQEAEQQKIADCLRSLENLIAAQARKVDALQTLKKGLTQQLFPRESETQPRLRFPEFRLMGEWVSRPLSFFIEEFREKSSVQDEYEVLTSARSGLVRQREYFFDNDRITGRQNIGFNVVPPNYITYRSRSDDRRFFFNENNLGITGIISTYYPVFYMRNGVNVFFIELLSHFSELVGKRSVGTSQTVLSLNELRKIELPTPSTAEQKRIADCMSSLDNLITIVTQELETLTVHKKGLMRQLFPALEQVT